MMGSGGCCTSRNRRRGSKSSLGILLWLRPYLPRDHLFVFRPRFRLSHLAHVFRQLLTRGCLRFRVAGWQRPAPLNAPALATFARAALADALGTPSGLFRLAPFV